LHDNDLLSDVLTIPAGGEGEEPLTVYRAHLDDTISAVAFEVSAIGYAGPITSIMGVSADGKVLGVRVLSHAETPGLGDRIEVNRDDWILSFNGHSMDNTSAKQWHVKKDGGKFDQFTGATITPRAVVKSVYEGLQTFRRHREELLSETAHEEATQENGNE
jgi:electron transport complex protein RnfG